VNRKEYLLVQAGEEAAELIQELSKCLRFGPYEIYEKDCRTNAVRVIDEFNDLLALLEMLVDEGILPCNLIRGSNIKMKKNKVKHYMEYAVKCGTLE